MENNFDDEEYQDIYELSFSEKDALLSDYIIAYLLQIKKRNTKTMVKTSILSALSLGLATAGLTTILTNDSNVPSYAKFLMTSIGLLLTPKIDKNFYISLIDENKLIKSIISSLIVKGTWFKEKGKNYPDLLRMEMNDEVKKILSIDFFYKEDTISLIDFIHYASVKASNNGLILTEDNIEYFSRCSYVGPLYYIYGDLGKI